MVCFECSHSHSQDQSSFGAFTFATSPASAKAGVEQLASSLELSPPSPLTTMTTIGCTEIPPCQVSGVEVFHGRIPMHAVLSSSLSCMYLALLLPLSSLDMFWFVQYSIQCSLFFTVVHQMKQTGFFTMTFELCVFSEFQPLGHLREVS